MQVIGAGYPRTGTLSIHKALEQLLEGKCYHMKTVFSETETLDRWHDWAINGAPLDLAAMTDDYVATVDAPLCFHYKELMELYPDAKVLLSVREGTGWFKSWSGLVGTFDKLAWVRVFNKRMKKLVPFLNEMITREDLGRSEAEAIERFERHNAEVQEYVPADRLLVFEAREGWEPLCEFLDVPVPDEPFPHLNSGSGFVRDAVGRMLTGRDLSRIGTK